jgi:4'-phosphopantetheinyl transferase
MSAVVWQSACEHEVPVDNEWLTERELAWLNRMRFPKRRLEYRMARWCAKAAIAGVVDPPPAIGQIEIGHLPEGAPAGYVDGLEMARRISMTDRAGWAICAIAPEGVEVGVDLELVETRSPLFVRDFFTPAEAARAEHGADPMMSNLIWSAKESALKVLRTGLRRDTRSVEVEIEDAAGDGWARFSVAGDGIATPFPGWWRRYGVFVVTIVADAPTGPPVALEPRPGLATAEPVHSWLGQPGPIDLA